MITFKDIVETKNEIKDIKQFIDTTLETKTFYGEKNNIENTTRATIHQLIGKYFNQKKKACLDEVKSKTTYGSNRYLQISKAGIGHGYSQRDHIQVYGSLFEDSYDGTGFIKEVINNDRVFNLVKNNLNDNGKNVMDLIKKVLKENPISKPEAANISYEIKITPEEANIFDIKKGNMFVKILDGNVNISMIVSKTPKVKDEEDGYSYGRDDTKVFDVRTNLTNDNTDEDEVLIKLLFIHNHKAEFAAALQMYKDKAKDEHNKWLKFDEAFKAETAKYTMLGLI